MYRDDPPDHRHDASLEDTFAFLNTDELDGAGHPVENLRSIGAALSWLVEHDLVHAKEAHRVVAATAGRPEDGLARVHGARAAMREIVEALVAGRPAEPAALATVNAVLEARAVPMLLAHEGALAIGHRHGGDPLDGALAALAGPLVALVAAGDRDRLRICANDGCRWVFHDTSRTGRRRWCSMASCGNRAKAARHRARRRRPAVSTAPGGAGSTAG